MKKTNKGTSNDNGSLTTDEIQYPGQDLEGKYGFCKYTPSWLQFCNNPTGFLAVISIYYATHGALSNGIFPVVITTLERRFGLKSSETGFIASCYDISYFAFCLFLTFYANRGHRLRMLAISSILYGIGVLLFALPHFTTGLYQYGEAESPFCNANRTLGCQKEREVVEDVHSNYYIFILAMVLQGIGCVPLYTVPFPIFEDSLSKKKSPLYLGIINTMTIVGPMIGYTTGGFLLSIYVDFDDPTSTGGKNLKTHDPRWSGVWWFGYLVAGAICLSVIMIPLFGFPQQFPGSAKVRALRKSEVHASASEEIAKHEDFGKTIKDMPMALWMLLKNPTFLFTALATSTMGHLIAGYGVFLPKLIENQYNTTPKMAAFFSGAISLPGGVVGCIASSIFVSKYNMTTSQLLKFSATAMLLVTFFSFITLHYCSNYSLAGVTAPYEEMDVGIFNTNLTSSCNGGCNCREKYFNPVCANSVNYFSACHAGCGDFNVTSKRFTECSCVLNGNKTAEPGMCKNSCNSIIPFFALTFVVVVTWFSVSTPAQLVLMRSVPDSQRSLAMGVQLFLIRAIGSIPGQLLFGAIFDAACILWQENECEEGRGSCYMYDSKTLAISITFVGFVAQALTCLLFYLALRFYRSANSIHSFPLDQGKEINFVFRKSNTVNNGNNNEKSMSTLL